MSGVGNEGGEGDYVVQNRIEVFPAKDGKGPTWGSAYGWENM